VVRIFFAVPRSAWVDLNLRQSLEDMGHQLVRFDFPGWPEDADARWREHGKPRTNQRLLDAVREAGRIDVFFGYLYSSVVYPETIDLIRRTGVPTVNFSCNNVHQFDLVRDIAPRFDLCIVPERAAQDDFVSVGAHPVRIQLAANPRVYFPVPEARTYDVTFVGQRYADRAELLRYLYCNGVAVRAWGAGWQARKRLSVAQIRAAMALLEDERFDGFQRMLRRRATRDVGRWRARLGFRDNHEGVNPLTTPRESDWGPLAPSPPGSGHSGSAQGPSTPGSGHGGSAQGPSTPGSGHGGSAQGPSTPGPRPWTLNLDPGRGQNGSARGPGKPTGDDPGGSLQDSLKPTPIALPSVDTSAFGGPRLLQRDLVRIFSRSRVSLGFATAGDSHRSARRLTHLRLREFEAPMSGALYLTEYQDELAEYFTPGVEVLTYRDRDELLEQARYYLAHQEQAERIRRAGLERARREHTWQHRFNELFALLGVA
jgi:hypothetical protein